MSLTALDNALSRAVMQRIGLVDSGRDFEHPAPPESSVRRRHWLSRITRERCFARQANN